VFHTAYIRPSATAAASGFGCAYLRMLTRAAAAAYSNSCAHGTFFSHTSANQSVFALPISFLRRRRTATHARPHHSRGRSYPCRFSGPVPMSASSRTNFTVATFILDSAAAPCKSIRSSWTEADFEPSSTIRSVAISAGGRVNSRAHAVLANGVSPVHPLMARRLGPGDNTHPATSTASGKIIGCLCCQDLVKALRLVHGGHWTQGPPSVDGFVCPSWWYLSDQKFQMQLSYSRHTSHLDDPGLWTLKDNDVNYNMWSFLWDTIIYKDNNACRRVNNKVLVQSCACRSGESESETVSAKASSRNPWAETKGRVLGPVS
jgi:hypothetical protein